jgi:hypothetical protein
MVATVPVSGVPKIVPSLISTMGFWYATFTLASSFVSGGIPSGKRNWIARKALPFPLVQLALVL